MAKINSQLDRAIKYAIAEWDRFGGLDDLPFAVQIVLLVHAAQGIIDNGGLQYFFESDFPDKPPYEKFVAAYRAIGAKDAAETLAAAVQLFPFKNPHLKQPLRDKFLNKFLKGGGHRPDSPFEPLTDRLCGNEVIWTKLADYVAEHSAAFPSEK